MSFTQHVPVLVREMLDIFAPAAGDCLLDATVGLGGHAQAFLDASSPSGTVVGLDADAAALEVAARNLKEYEGRVTLLQANFAALQDVLPVSQLFTHILFDLGLGSHQLADENRAFSFASPAALTMRFGSTTQLPDAIVPALNTLATRLGRLPDAGEIISGLSAQELAHVLRTYGEERHARRIAVAVKASEPRTATELAEIIRGSVPAKYAHGRIDAATRTFQALRLAVNRELEALTHVLPQAVARLKPGGKIAVISFHSLEDRIVKHFFRDQAADCVCPPEYPVCRCDAKATLKVLTKRPVTASSEERERNPRARSAKLRAAQKLGP